MSTQPHIALMQAQPFPLTSEVPDWIHLLPADVDIRTADSRGPYRVTDTAALIAATAGMKLPIDENHAIDLAGPRGEPAPARGYIVEMQSRADGIWGRVEWTGAGRALMADKAYLGLSPVIIHDKAKRIIAIARASLTNRPNLQGLTALHSQETEDMALLNTLAKMLGLDETSSEEQVTTALQSRLAAKPDGNVTALQSQMGQIGVALGIAQDAAPDAIIAAAKAAKGTDLSGAVVALQTELAAVTTKLNSLQSTGAKSAAETFVDGEIKRGRVGVKPLRDHYIAMHQQDAARVEKEIGALPVLGGGGVVAALPAATLPNGEVALQAQQVEAAKKLGIDPKLYAATLKAEQTAEEAL